MISSSVNFDLFMAKDPSYHGLILPENSTFNRSSFGVEVMVARNFSYRLSIGGEVYAVGYEFTL